MAMNSTRMGQERKFSDQAPAVASGGNIPTIQFSTGRAKALSDFSRTLFGLSASFEDQLDQTAEVEGQKAGALAGLAGETEEQSYETIRGRAYNKAMLETFVTSLDTKAMVGATRLQQQHYNDPVALEKGLNDFYGGMADEIDKVAPGAGASFRARATARSLGAVETARDERVKMTRDVAEASLIEHEAAVMGSVSKNAANLFSDNPAKSSASSLAVGQSISEYMRTYDAVDTVTGKPLFTEVDKAKARSYIKDKVMTGASLSWFDAQPDKVAAWSKLQDPEFSFNVKIPGEQKAKVTYENKGKTRDKPVTADVMSKLETAGGAMGPNIQVHITSGGQPTAQEIRLARARGENIGGRTGSVRHDHGASADVVLSVNGKRVTPQEDPQLYQQFAENAAAAGFTGIGHYAWGVHVGGGSQATWGPSTTGADLDPAFASAVERGRGKKLTLTEPAELNVPLRKAMSEEAFNKLDSEMRQRITFANTAAERDRVAEERTVKREQDAAESEISLRMWAAGGTDETGKEIKPITAQEIIGLSRDGVITNDKAQAFIKALSTERPSRSDDQVYRELQRRVWNGEDIQDDIIAAGAKLTPSDATQLLNKNNDLNREGAGKFSTEEKYNFDQLEKLLKPDTMTASLDPSRQIRTYEALDEYRRRVKARGESGEKIDEIVRDIKGRAFLDMNSISSTALDGLVLPRYSVKDTALPGMRMIDIDQSRKALKAALDANKITRSEAEEQAILLKQWDELQRQSAADTQRAKGTK